jgi:hypothetical protein
MGGLRSIAQLPTPLAPAQKPESPRPRPRRSKARKRRVPWWLYLWLGGTVTLLAVGAGVIYRLTNYGTIRINVTPASARVDFFEVDGQAVEWAGTELRLYA